jgi:hypothetical protein
MLVFLLFIGIKINKILYHMRKDVKESLKITCCSKQKFLKYYKELWTETTHEETEWGTDNEDEQEITLEELELALKKIKCEKSPGEDQINSELYKYAGNSFHNRLCNRTASSL